MGAPFIFFAIPHTYFLHFRSKFSQLINAVLLRKVLLSIHSPSNALKDRRQAHEITLLSPAIIIYFLNLFI
jgi:hypothetical protein